jgi:DNA-binding transcriptional LysR family regulator
VKLQRNTVSAPQKIVCFASADQVIQNEPLSWKDLCNYPLISGPEESVIRKTIFEKFRNEGLEVKQLAAEVNNIEWCKTLVENGKGLSFTVLGDIEEQISKRRLKIVQLKENLYLTAEAVMRTGSFSNPTIKEFVSMVKLAFGSQPNTNPTQVFMDSLA